MGHRDVNKLIADFVKKSHVGIILDKDFQEEIVDTTYPDYTVCKFHCDWNWIMPVAKLLVDEYDELEQVEDLLEVLPTADIDEIIGAIVRTIEEINQNQK